MIRFESVTHRFGPRAVLRSVSFHVPRGQVCGFVGPNGAGKTTAMRLLVTLLPVQEGRVSVGGIDVDEDPLEVRRLVGFMPDAFGVYERVTIEEYLEFFAASFGITAAGRGRKVSEVMDLARIGGLRDRMVSELSKGMRQRLALARTMLHDPALLVSTSPRTDSIRARAWRCATSSSSCSGSARRSSSRATSSPSSPTSSRRSSCSSVE